MSESDRLHWDPRHAVAGMAEEVDNPPPPPAFAHVAHLFPTGGHALEMACGRGRGAVWLAKRGMSYSGIDVSPVAIGLARDLVEASGVGDRCHFEVHDLDHGLPEGDPVDLLLCYLFRKSPLHDEQMVGRLASGGLLAVACLSQVGASSPGKFHAPPGELREAFGHLDVLDEGESDGMARILVRNV